MLALATTCACVSTYYQTAMETWATVEGTLIVGLVEGLGSKLENFHKNVEEQTSSNQVMSLVGVSLAVAALCLLLATLGVSLWPFAPHWCIYQEAGFKLDH